MAAEALIDRLRAFLDFGSLPDTACACLEDATQVVSVEAGKVLSCQGEAFAFYPLVLSGRARIFVMDDDGLSPQQVITAWFVHFPPNQPPPHPIFAPIGPGQPPIAFMDTPVAHTAARFSEGLSREPNQIRVRSNGSGRFFTWLDYNPLVSGQVPLVNAMVLSDQQSAPSGLGVEQPNCCQDFPAGPRPEPIGGSYLRRFDPATGFQLTGADGRPELVRSPSRPVAIALFVHIDGVTSGIVPGVPTPPFLVDPPVTTGSFYLLGIFPLAALGLD